MAATASVRYPEVWGGQTGMSAEARELKRRLHTLLDSPPSLTLAGRYRALDVAWQEAYETNWDGYSARGVNRATYEAARAFLDALPHSIPDPEIGAEPDGDIAFEWYAAPRLVVSVSIDALGHLTYAALFGASRSYGDEPFTGELPKPIGDNLSRLFRLAQAVGSARAV